MKSKDVIFLLESAMMISRGKTKKKTFEERKTKLRSNTSQKLDNTKSKRAHNRPQKRKRE